ncbi:hypothetical protein KIN_31590 [Litoreibacter roseus]|uniref:TRAP transporter small permease protein n=2 Tax=Litoreibacter roseus TaxID=2601869 RepID=A0A6N6JJ41_9RHOB|nr:hypothetical protein KIN_31590 [Litoreibacter roseus]
MAFMLAAFGWLVFGRYVLNNTPTWVEQLSLVLICYIVFLGAAAGVRENTHLKVSFICQAMPAKVQWVLRLAVDLAVCAFGVVMFFACLELMAFGWDTKLPMLQVPESVRTLPVAICGALICLFAAARVLGRLERKEASEDAGIAPRSGIGD